MIIRDEWQKSFLAGYLICTTIFWMKADDWAPGVIDVLVEQNGMIKWPNGAVLKLIKNSSNICTWNLKDPLINGCCNWMIPNLYMKNSCFTKHPWTKMLFRVPGITGDTFLDSHKILQQISSQFQTWMSCRSLPLILQMDSCGDHLVTLW